MLLRKLFTLGAFLLTLSVQAQSKSGFERQLEGLRGQKGKLSEDRRLDRFFELHWNYTLNEYPESATFSGFPGFDDQLTDLSAGAIARRKREALSALNFLRGINRKKLKAQAQVNFDLFLRGIEQQVEINRFPNELFVIDQGWGIQRALPQLMDGMPSYRSSDFDNRLKRLRLLPRLVDQQIALLEEGLKRGLTPPKVTLRDLPEQFESLVKAELEKNPIFASFTKFPSTVVEPERSRLRKEAETVAAEQVLPALKKLRDYLVKSYLPGARESIGMSALPQGEEWYRARVIESTTLKVSPQEIHSIGLGEVARLRAEIENKMKEVKFRGDFKDFSKHLRSDKRFLYKDARELLRDARDIAKRIDPELPRLFGKLPRLSFGISSIPSHAEKSQSLGYYEPGSLKAGRAAKIRLNTYDLKSQTRWNLEALMAHEGMPGHHLQVSLSEEMENLPKFRQFGAFSPTAFVEGWGLYAESLGSELGLYKDVHSQVGKLAFEMLRSIRLVVDTGLHSLNWSRDQAIDFFERNSLNSEVEIANEVDRYIGWPAQAVAYKMGALKLAEIKKQAQESLGDRFSYRDFHDALLSNGAVPLDFLERNMKEWVQKQARQSKAAPR